MKIALLILCVLVGMVVLWALIRFGRKRAPRIRRTSTGSILDVQVRPSGLALMAVFTLVLVLFAAAITLAPDGPLGSFLRTPRGALAAFLAAVAGFSVVAIALEKCGSRPFVDRDDD